ncbi:ATP-grasp domain-containing protein [Ornithinimicrobium sp. Y1847]|uniref:ATP-grasp domain-containing protein n=1 Tax=Ornithinimicrobium sp. Y1847 TaxID=3405419 RepID=UPI003B67E549
MRIVVLTSQPVPRTASVTADCLDLLRSWGARVEVVLPETLVDVTSLAPDADLYLLKSVNDHVVSLAHALAAGGGRCVNTADVARLCRDRVAATASLAAHSVPVPQTWTTRDLPALEELLQDGPLVLKPGRVGAGTGSRVVWDVEELLDLSPTEQPWLVQRLQETSARDRKLYRIGEQVFGVKRRWPATSLLEKQGEPFTVTEELHRITDRVGAALGTDLFGVDVVETTTGPVVVDVHHFPGFKGVPDGALRLADYIFAAAAGSEPEVLQDDSHQNNSHQNHSGRGRA